MVMPFVLLYRVQITLKQKIGLAAVFGLATIIIVTAIVRAISITQKARVDVILLSLWSIIESTIGRSYFLPPLNRMGLVSTKALALIVRLIRKHLTRLF